MSQAPKVLVSPLNWGIGHAARMVPVIHELIRQGAVVHLGASGPAMAFLQTEFPGLARHEMPGYEIQYPVSSGGMALKIAGQVPALFRSIRKEHSMAEELITEHGIEGVISDNRYGLYSKRVPCVFVTHQVFIRTPYHLGFLRPVLSRINFHYIGKFKECWVPDTEGEVNLSGELSHKKTLSGPFHFIGPLSRFDRLADDPQAASGDHDYDLMVMLSGPEPQRTILQQKILAQIGKMGIKSIVVLGKPGDKNSVEAPPDCTIYNHLETPALLEKMQRSKLIVSRSGYSTIMDLAASGSRALLIPTPGQTEQEYLGRYLHEKGYYFSCHQDELDLEKAMKSADGFNGIRLGGDKEALESRVSAFLRSI